MASGWLAQTISGVVPSPGLERPLKITNISIETTAAPGAAGQVTFTDASTAANVIYERTVPATANINIQDVFNATLLWRNFQCTAIPTNTVVWIYHR